MAPLESVPNVSEGRDASVVGAIGAAFASAGARLLDTHSDAEHHRSVFTLVGDDRALEDGLVTGIGAARHAIDLEVHEGVHPRVGAADVVPVVPLVGEDVARAEAVARRVAERIGRELELPVFLYGTLGEGRRPAFFRRGGTAELARRIEAGEVDVAEGPSRLDPKAGAVLVGVRAPLLAYNVELRGPVDVARAVAAAVRESSGGLPGVQALGLELGDGRVQVSTNVVDLDVTAPHELAARIEREAEARGSHVRRGELVGLVAAASVAAAAHAAGIRDPIDDDGVPTEAALEAAARALHLDRLDADRVLEWHLVR